jgi:hypothetical protein
MIVAEHRTSARRFPAPWTSEGGDGGRRGGCGHVHGPHTSRVFTPQQRTDPRNRLAQVVLSPWWDSSVHSRGTVLPCRGGSLSAAPIVSGGWRPVIRPGYSGFPRQIVMFAQQVPGCTKRAALKCLMFDRVVALLYTRGTSTMPYRKQPVTINATVEVKCRECGKQGRVGSAFQYLTNDKPACKYAKLTVALPCCDHFRKQEVG